MTKGNVDSATTRGILASIDTAISQTRTAAAVDRVLQSAAPSIWGCTLYMLDPWYDWWEFPAVPRPDAPTKINSTHSLDCECSRRCAEDVCFCDDPLCIIRTSLPFQLGGFSYDGSTDD